MTVRQRLVVTGYRTLRRLAQRLPDRIGRRVFLRLGDLAYRVMRLARARVIANQAQVLGLDPHDPRVEASAREAFRLYALYWRDTFLAERMSDEEVIARIRVEGRENLDRALAEGRGAVVALPHMGNWDVGGRWMRAIGLPVVSVAEDLRPPELTALFREHRRALGIEVIGSADGQVGRQLAAALAANRIVALVADRDVTGRGVEVQMFGRTRRMPAGPAMLALSTGAPLIPTPTYTDRDGWRIVIGEPIAIETSGERRRDVAALTQRLATLFERAISAAPADWHVFQPGWEP